MTGHCWESVDVCIPIWMSTKDVWNELQAQTRQLCPCQDIFIHAETGWHHPSTQKEKQKEGGMHEEEGGEEGTSSIFSSQAVSRFITQALPYQTFKIWAVWQHTALFWGQTPNHIFIRFKRHIWMNIWMSAFCGTCDNVMELKCRMVKINTIFELHWCDVFHQ